MVKIGILANWCLWTTLCIKFQMGVSMCRIPSLAIVGPRLKWLAPGSSDCAQCILAALIAVCPTLKGFGLKQLAGEGFPLCCPTVAKAQRTPWVFFCPRQRSPISSAFAAVWALAILQHSAGTRSTLLLGQPKSWSPLWYLPTVICL